MVERATTHSWGRTAPRCARSIGRPHSCVAVRPTSAPDAKKWLILTVAKILDDIAQICTLQCYFGVYFPPWTHKQFASRVYTLFYSGPDFGRPPGLFKSTGMEYTLYDMEHLLQWSFWLYTLYWREHAVSRLLEFTIHSLVLFRVSGQNVYFGAPQLTARFKATIFDNTKAFCWIKTPAT